MTSTNITAPTPLFKARFGRSKAKVRDRKVIWLILPTVVVLVTLFVGGFGAVHNAGAPDGLEVLTMRSSRFVRR